MPREPSPAEAACEREAARRIAVPEDGQTVGGPRLPALDGLRALAVIAGRIQAP